MAVSWQICRIYCLLHRASSECSTGNDKRIYRLRFIVSSSLQLTLPNAVGVHISCSIVMIVLCWKTLSNYVFAHLIMSNLWEPAMVERQLEKFAWELLVLACDQCVVHCYFKCICRRGDYKTIEKYLTDNMAEAQNFHDLNYTCMQLDLELSPEVNSVLSFVWSQCLWSQWGLHQLTERRISSLVIISRTDVLLKFWWLLKRIKNQQ